MAKNTGMIVILVAIGLIVLVGQGYIDLGGLMGGREGVSQGEAFPSDLETTITLNTKDALATTDTDATVSYYVFKSNGEFVKSGTTSSGTASFTVNWAGDYEVLAYYDTGTKFYPESITFTADGGEGAQKTINMGLIPASNITIDLARDPVDLDGNITVGTGQQVNFDLLYHVTDASSATYKPVITVDVNRTSVSDVSLGGLPEVACPDRLSVDSGRKLMCFQDSTLKSIEHIRILQGSILFSSSTAPGTGTEYMKFDVIDTQMYADPNYAVKGRSAFKEGTEDPNDDSNVGASDGQAADSTDHANTKAYLYYE